MLFFLSSFLFFHFILNFSIVPLIEPFCIIYDVTEWWKNTANFTRSSLTNIVCSMIIHNTFSQEIQFILWFVIQIFPMLLFIESSDGLSCFLLCKNLIHMARLKMLLWYKIQLNAFGSNDREIKVEHNDKIVYTLCEMKTTSIHLKWLHR